MNRFLQISNVWHLEHEGRSFLIDTGHGIERPALWWALRRVGRVSAVLLTHRHSDHAGNAAWLRERLQCPVVAAAGDAPYLDGRKPPPPLARGQAPFYQEALNRVEDLLPARSPVDDTYSSGPWRWGFFAVATPGHTEGSSMLYHEPTRTLFSGDSIIVGIPPLRFPMSLRLAYPGFSLDVERNWSAVKSFLEAAPPVESLCAGHGPRLSRGVGSALRRLLAVKPGDRVPA